MPEWSWPLVQYRDMFTGAALVVRRATGLQEFWKLVFAVQSPYYYLGMCQLRMVPAPSMHDLAAPLAPTDISYEFHMNFAQCCSAADVKVQGSDQLSILFRLVHTGGTRLTTDMHPIGLGVLLAGEDHDLGPREDPVQEAAKDGKVDPEYEQLVEVMPWLRHLDFQQGLTGGEGSATDDAPEGVRRASAGVLAAIDDDEILAGLTALEREREVLAADDAAAPGHDFIPKIRGGLSEVLKSGDAVHAVQGQCTNADATYWARVYGATTFKATFSEHTPAACKILVRSWCHRMQHFYDLQQAAPPSAELAFTPDLIAAYREPTELAALLADRANPKWNGWMTRAAVIQQNSST